jgi:uncharacterized membrane-anchored protein YhcB (DUF1043 family)
MNKDRSSKNINKENFSLIIDELIDKKSKMVSKKHYAEGFDLLGAEIFPQDSIPFSEDEIKKVGADFLAEWIIKNWGTLNEARRILFLGKLIDQLQGDSMLSRSFNVLLCSKLIGPSPESAIRLLGKICQQTKISPVFPLNKDLCHQIRRSFLKPKNNLITQLPLSFGFPGSKDVAKYGIGSAFLETNKIKTPGGKCQIQVLKWITESGIDLVIPDVLAELIRNSEAAAKNVSKIKEYLPSFPDEIKWERAVILDKEGNQLGQMTPSDDRKLITTIKPEDEIVDQFDPISSLNQLQSYVREIQNLYKKAQDKISRLEKDHRELDKKQSELKDKLNFRKAELIKKSAEIAELKTNLATSQQNLSNLIQEKDKLLSQIVKEKTYYNDKMNTFSRTIEAKSNYKREVIINRIRESLGPEYRNLERIKNMDMTVEAGQVLRALLERIFSKLSKEGIDFAEGNEL